MWSILFIVYATKVAIFTQEDRSLHLDMGTGKNIIVSVPGILAQVVPEHYSKRQSGITSTCYISDRDVAKAEKEAVEIFHKRSENRNLRMAPYVSEYAISGQTEWTMRLENDFTLCTDYHTKPYCGTFPIREVYFGERFYTTNMVIEYEITSREKDGELIIVACTMSACKMPKGELLHVTKESLADVWYKRLSIDITVPREECVRIPKLMSGRTN